MNQKTKVLLLFILAIVIIGGILFWYMASRPSGNTEDALEGTLQHTDCTQAGVGCSEWTLSFASGDSQGLASNQDVKAYAGKKVRVTGKYVKELGPSGPSFFEVQSITLVE